MENIVFDRNYELTSEDNGYADAVYEKAIEPDGFFASFGKKMDAIPKIIVPEDQANYEYLLERCDQFAQDHTDGFTLLWTISTFIPRSTCISG